MAMVVLEEDGSSLAADSQPVGWLGLRVGSTLALSLHSSNESGSSQNDSAINIVIVLLLLSLLKHYFHLFRIYYKLIVEP